MTMSEKTPAPVGAAVALDLDADSPPPDEDHTHAEYVAWSAGHWRRRARAAEAEVRRLTGIEAHRDNLAAMIRRLSEFLDGRSLNSWKHGACWAAEDAIKTLIARAESAEAEVVTLRAKVAAVEAVERGLSEGWVMLATVSDRAEFVRTFRAALATGEGEHVAREVFTAVGIPFVRCSCTNAKSPTSSRWLTEHVPNGGVAELQAVVKRQADQA